MRIREKATELGEYALSYVPFGTYLAKRRNGESYDKWDLVLDLEKVSMLGIAAASASKGTMFAGMQARDSLVHTFTASLPTMYSTFLRHHEGYGKSIEKIEEKLDNFDPERDKKVGYVDRAKVLAHRILSNKKFIAIPLLAEVLHFGYHNPFLDLYNSDLAVQIDNVSPGLDSITHAVSGGAINYITKRVIENIPVHQNTDEVEKLEQLKKNKALIGLGAATAGGAGFEGYEILEVKMGAKDILWDAWDTVEDLVSNEIIPVADFVKEKIDERKGRRQ